MLENRKEAAYKIMETIGRQEGIEKVRVYSSEGKILFSSDNTGEVGRMVDQKAEACFGCHSEARPLERLATSERSRIFFSEHGEDSRGVNHRVLGIINPMYNDSGCSSAACHAHPKSQKVLGVIDVTMDLSEVDSQMAWARAPGPRRERRLGGRHLHHRRLHPLPLHREADQGARSRHEADLGGGSQPFHRRHDERRDGTPGDIVQPDDHGPAERPTRRSRRGSGTWSTRWKSGRGNSRRPSRSSFIRRSSPPWERWRRPWRTRSTTR